MHEISPAVTPTVVKPHAAPAATKRASRLLPLIASAVAVTLISACGGGGGSSPTPAPVPTPPPSGATSVTISGVAKAEIVPNTTGPLNYAGTTQQPIKGVVVELLNAATNAVIATTSTDATGAYSVAAVPVSTSVIVRVRAHLLKTGAAPTWDITVRDNTQAGAPYVLDTAAFDSGTTATLTKNVLAASGWGGTSYSSPRASGPFAITNTAYSAVQKVLTASPSQPFPELSVYWSVNNTTGGNDPANGLLATTYFSYSVTGTTVTRAIYVLGKADADTDEFDETVIAHEWGHYFQNAFSRDDSVGGSHGGGDKLDGRVAFSEGWGNAWSGMATNRSTYTDSSGTNQASGGGFVLTNAAVAGNKGWFSETSIQYLLYTLYTQAGFTPIWQTMTSPAFVNGTALTQIHSFAATLRTVNATAGASFTGLLSPESVANNADAFGSTENNSGGVASAIPVYRPLVVGTPLTNVCTVSTAGVSNKLGNYVAFKFNVPTAKTYTITVNNGSATSDPDFEVYQNGFKGQAGASTAGSDTTTVALAAGEAVLIFNDYKLAAGAAPSCFTVTVQ